ncbi:MAG TPA: type II toxin-antitoxin system HicA family toxin [Bacillota bacterium]|nr:type II toxin-antitoxin system HicA family toxin [Bacillota bacterium]HQC35917.1 type II toxin-antitoxin system HicA family toxin [Bacillota bacterium]
MKRRELVKKLEKAGYKLVRIGNHFIYEKAGCRSVQVPNHRELNERTAKQILKDAGLL